MLEIVSNNRAYYIVFYNIMDLLPEIKHQVSFMDFQIVFSHCELNIVFFRNLFFAIFPFISIKLSQVFSVILLCFVERPHLKNKTLIVKDFLLIAYLNLIYLFNLFRSLSSASQFVDASRLSLADLSSVNGHAGNGHFANAHSASHLGQAGLGFHGSSYQLNRVKQ